MAILTVILSVVFGFFKQIPPIVWLILAVFLFGYYQGCGGCHRTPRIRPIESQWFTVKEVLSGNTIVIKTGVRERRTETVQLKYTVTFTGKFANAGIANLQQFSGKRIRIEMEGILGNRLPSLVVAYGENGGCLNLEQIMSGMCDCTPDAPRDPYIVQRDIAKKNKTGIWSR